LKISILLAVRNEEHHLLRCLNGLASQDFPAQEMEILIGNDQSEDRSKEIILAFVSNKPYFKLIDIQGNIGSAKGKGNVIAHLAHHAKGDYFLITDADVCVPTTWASAMAAGFEQKNKVGIVTGFTVVEQQNLLSSLDCVDWVQNIGLMNLASLLRIPTNAMGNNMAVSKTAYFEMGGIETQPFMVCEDLLMFKAITKKKWSFVHLHSPKALGVSHPQESFYELLQQRQRWLDGALKIHPLLVILLLINGLFLFPFLLLLFWHWQIALAVWGFRFLFHAINIAYFAFKIEKIAVLKYLPLYELFITFFNPLVFFFYLFPTKMTWKGRKF
jgi:cellulose synthase/poly-beta-1,6-N-acetylglucosamine synthase-like glycosyltransferase